MNTLELYISPSGDDQWSGRIADPKKDSNDGPFKTIERAREEILFYNSKGLLKGEARVYLRGGEYLLNKPIAFRPEDSYPVIYQAYQDEKPEITGAVPVSDWTTETVNGVEAWVSDVSTIVSRYQPFNSLFVNGKRKSRSRFPKEGTLDYDGVPGLEFEKPNFFLSAPYFKFKDGEIPVWDNIKGGEVIAKHLWVEERLPLDRIDYDKSRFYFTRSSTFDLGALGDVSDFWVENIFEELNAPGEWYLDVDAHKLYYIPEPGETIENSVVNVPLLYQLIRFEGTPNENKTVDGIRFQGVTFSHTDWIQPTGFERIFDPYIPELERDSFSGSYLPPGFLKNNKFEWANFPQASAHLPGVINLLGAKNCAFEECSFTKLGFYGINIGNGCASNQVVGCDFNDIGGGGVKIHGGGPEVSRALQASGNLISDNEIQNCGRVFLSAVGVCIGLAKDNSVIHNHIHHLYYTGVSCGWIWGYSDGVNKDNLIAYNHIHDIGQKYISDMGAIYILGIQPGTIVRGNTVHDIRSKFYGGWGIYLDEGASHILVEDNIVYNTDCACFNQHWGRENIVRENIFAYGAEGIVSLGAGEDHNAFNFEKNTVISDGEPFFYGGYDNRLKTRPVRSEGNKFYDIQRTEAESLKDFVCGGSKGDNNEGAYTSLLTFDQWKDMGNDHYASYICPKLPAIDKQKAKLDLTHKDFLNEGEAHKAGVRVKGGRQFILPYYKRYRKYLMDDMREDFR